MEVQFTQNQKEYWKLVQDLTEKNDVDQNNEIPLKDWEKHFIDLNTDSPKASPSMCPHWSIHQHHQQ